MKKKYDAIGRFEFMVDVYDRLKNAGFSEQDKEINMCGVFFYKEYAYTTNNHIIGRIKIDDNQPMNECLFWSYKDDDITKFNEQFLFNLKNCSKISNAALNIFENNFVGNLDYIFNRYTDNFLYIRKNDWINLINTIADKETIKTKSILKITVGKDLNLILKLISNKGIELGNASFSSYLYPSERVRIKENSTISVNAYYFYKIMLHSFSEYDIIGVRFKYDDARTPLVIFGKNPHKPEIYWAVAQARL